MAAAIINPRLLNIAEPTARLTRRQQLILRRMGAVTPPESVAPHEPLAPQVPDQFAPLPDQFTPLPDQIENAPAEPAATRPPPDEQPAPQEPKR